MSDKKHPHQDHKEHEPAVPKKKPAPVTTQDAPSDPPPPNLPPDTTP